MKAILCCVDFSDLLAVTLPANLHHFDEVIVVTTKTDVDTHKVCNDNGVKFLATNAFYEPAGTPFNKYKSLNQGVSLIKKRKGWLCIMDADIIWPHNIEWDLEIGKLYTPRRHMFKDLSQPIPEDEDDWCKYSLHLQQREWAGYTQIFNLEDPVLPAGDLFQEWTSCSGGDSHFQRRWSKENKIRPDWNCLHLGPDHSNWCGRTTKYIDGTEPKDKKKHQQQLQKLKYQRRKLKSLQQEII